MDADRWPRVDALFHATIARAREERSAFLEEACGADGDLRQQVERLVRAHERADGFLKAPAAAEALRILASGRSPSAASPRSRRTAPAPTSAAPRASPCGARWAPAAWASSTKCMTATRDEVVALKTLRRARAADVYRLKREFRSLADVAHPNLVSLYELVVDGANCFFTMELVDGVNFVDYVRGSATDGRAVSRRSARGTSLRAARHGARRAASTRQAAPGRQAVERARHGRGTRRHSRLRPHERRVPFGRRGRRALSPARPPIWRRSDAPGSRRRRARTGTASASRCTKRSRAICRPSRHSTTSLTISPGICRGLLERRSRRTTVGLGGLGVFFAARTRRTGSSRWTPETEAAFVGRREPLQTLDAAWRRARAGQAVTVCIHGPSGIGKSALVESFLARAFGRDDLVVLRGRCYERESVPYKALDGVVDHLESVISARCRERMLTRSCHRP